MAVSDVASLNPGTYSIKESWPVVYCLNTGNIPRGTLGGVQEIRPGEDNLPSRARRKVRSGDIVYSTVRPNQKHYGILMHPGDNVLFSVGFTVLRLNSECLRGEALYLYLTQNKPTKGLQQIAEQSVSTYPSIKAEDLGALKLPLPVQEEKEKLHEHLAPTFECIDENYTENRKPSALRDALLPKLMSGELDVSKVESGNE